MRALHTAATGMMAQELNVQVISNNIANMRTTGYKRQRAEFQDLLYEHVRRVGTQTSDQGNQLPAGVTPQVPTNARVSQGAVEKSNVKSVMEMTRMVEVTRTYTQIASMLQSQSDTRKSAIDRLAEVPTS